MANEKYWDGAAWVPVTGLTIKTGSGSGSMFSASDMYLVIDTAALSINNAFYTVTAKS